ncbi:MAG: hypothetical protein ACRD8Z_02580 [Nitrososphaeraceae archaeon]
MTSLKKKRKKKNLVIMTILLNEIRMGSIMIPSQPETFDTIQVTISFGDFNYLYEMVGRSGIGRMNERGCPTFHEFVSVSSGTQYELA